MEKGDKSMLPSPKHYGLLVPLRLLKADAGQAAQLLPTNPAPSPLPAPLRATTTLQVSPTSPCEMCQQAMKG